MQRHDSDTKAYLDRLERIGISAVIAMVLATASVTIALDRLWIVPIGIAASLFVAYSERKQYKAAAMKLKRGAYQDD